MRHRVWLVLGVAGMVAVVVQAACDMTADPERGRPLDISTAAGRESVLLETGRAAYATYCTGCHGEAGDGNGDAAVFFDPKPRNFVTAYFKFSSTRSGELPTDDDLRRTIKGGLKGSAMPPFELLPEPTVDALIAYLKTFSPKWKERGPARAIPVPDDPYRMVADKSEAIARGELIYNGYATCWTCHPAYTTHERINAARAALNFPTYDSARPDLHLAIGKENVEGHLIYPPDFLRDFVRSGASVDDLYRSIAAGITGTAMPTWVDSMDLRGLNEGDPPLVQQADLWAVAYYVQDLINQRPKKLAESQVSLRDRRRAVYLHGEPPKPPPPAQEPSTGPAVEIEF